MTLRSFATSLAAGSALAAGLVLAGGPVAAEQGRRGGTATGAPAAAPQPQRPGATGCRPWPPNPALPSLVASRWWQDETVKKDLVLTDQQLRRLDDLCLDRREDFDRAVGHMFKVREDLERLMAARVVTPDELGLTVVTAEALRSRAFETSTLMLYGATRLLSPEQYGKLRTWWSMRRSRPGNRATSDVVLYGGKEWWKDEAVKREIGLTADLSARIEEQYQRRQLNAAPLITELQKETQALDALIAARELRTEAVAARVLQVEALRSRVNESRTVMLYRFYRLLSPEQYQKFQALVERERRNGRGRGGGHP